MDNIERALADIVKGIAGTVDEVDVNRLMLAGKPVILIEAEAGGQNRSEELQEVVRHEIIRQRGDKPSVNQVIMQISSGAVNPVRLRESVKLYGAIMDELEEQATLFKVTYADDDSLDARLKVTILAWTKA